MWNYFCKTPKRQRNNNKNNSLLFYVLFCFSFSFVIFPTSIKKCTHVIFDWYILYTFRNIFIVADCLSVWRYCYDDCYCFFVVVFVVFILFYFRPLSKYTLRCYMIAIEWESEWKSNRKNEWVRGHKRLLRVYL